MKKFGPLAGVLLVFILMALALIKIYDKGKDQKPLRYADIPQETIDWINTLDEGLDDLVSIFNPIPRPTPWDNDGDLGNDPDFGLAVLSDEYFIIYYPESTAKEARRTLDLAHAAIPRMEDIIGKYYFPDDMNGRKVPIYLSTDHRDFEALIAKFGCSGDFTYTVGLTIYEISPSGMFLYAILLDGSYVFEDDAALQEDLWHEMTHYCFFASVDYNQCVNLPMWCIEGIAEYTGMNGRRPVFTQQEIEMIRRECDLNASDFPQVFEVYTGGHSIFCHMEDRYTVDGVKYFLQTLYGEGVPAAFKSNFSTTVSAFDADWKAALDGFREQ